MCLVLTAGGGLGGGCRGWGRGRVPRNQAFLSKNREQLASMQPQKAGLLSAAGCMHVSQHPVCMHPSLPRLPMAPLPAQPPPPPPPAAAPPLLSGMGESYMDGDYAVQDLGALLAVATANAVNIEVRCVPAGGWWGWGGGGGGEGLHSRWVYMRVPLGRGANMQ
jgi:hypothetical protein